FFLMCIFFFFIDPATPATQPLSLHDALPICRAGGGRGRRSPGSSGGISRGTRGHSRCVEAHHRRKRQCCRWSCRRRARRAPDRPDRKSTRLNSSHVKISYAVFCLKKKNESYT